jgi:threonine/homoserine/homoserine lactone efflux protein
MIPAVLFGLGFGLAASLQPGPMQAYFLSRVALVGRRRTMPAALAPLVSDGPIAVLALTALRHVPTGFARALQVIGGLMLLYFAFAIVRKIRAGRPDTNDHDASAPRSLAQAVAVNVANPGPYLGWSLVLGPEVTRLWPTQPAAALAIVACFYLVLTVGNALTIIAFGGLRAFGPERMRALLPVSAAVLGALGIYRIVISLT